MSIKPNQIRAARAMLNWTVAQLGEKLGVAATTISAIETGRSSGSVDLLNSMEQTFLSAGVEITPDGGVRPYQSNVRIYYDFMDILNDAEQILEPGDEILFHCADERRNTPEVTEKIKKLRNKGIRLRFTVEEGNLFTTGDPKDYNIVDPEYFANHEVRVTYADRYVINVIDKGQDVFIMIINDYIADTSRREFEYFFNKKNRE